jgi:hypothetical protein
MAFGVSATDPSGGSLNGVSRALRSSSESFIDEIAAATGTDPLAFRLRI